MKTTRFRVPVPHVQIIARYRYWTTTSCYKCADMRVKVDYALPATQMALAVALLWWNQLLMLASRRRCDMPGATPASSLLHSVNAPLAHEVWGSILYKLYIWDNALLANDVALIAAVGLFWYWVALNIRSWRQRRTVLMFSWRPARFTLDAFLVAYGALFGLIGLFGWYEAIRFAPSTAHGIGCFGPNLWFNLLPSIATGGIYLAWSLVLISFFGRDFIHCALRKTAAL